MPTSTNSLTDIETNSPTRIADVSLKPRGRVFPSPADWRDQILYFLLPDRFSDGNESERPLFDRANQSQYIAQDRRAWMAAGKVFQGGNIRGIITRLGYLKKLGMTAIWVGPVWKQRKDLQTYHGYGIQDFLEVEPRFGTRQDLRDLVDSAHDMGMYVILDIIYNHSANNFYYSDGGKLVSRVKYRYEPPWPLAAWRSGKGEPTATIESRDDGVWPREFQDPDFYTRAGSIANWDPAPWEDPLDPRNEFRRGDFFELKDLRVQEQQPMAFDPKAHKVLENLIKVYQYWIALTDCDGFRVDTVKHVSFEASRNFCGAIHEFTESIGKENFLVLGEVAGGPLMTRNYLDVFGRNLDAALDIGAPEDILSNMVKGLGSPKSFFDQFGGHDELGSHREVGRYHVSLIDEHDMIVRNPKQRFSAQTNGPARYEQVAHAVGVQLTTLGIPCIYYGTEQAFDGSQNDHDISIEPLELGAVPFADRYIREAMFGARFGAFRTSGCHFFNEDHPAYLRIAAIAAVVNQKNMVGMALRRGRQYFREIKVETEYLQPVQNGLVAWSRVLFDKEVVVVLNTNGAESESGWVSVDSDLSPAGSQLIYLYKSDWTDDQLRVPPTGQSVQKAQIIKDIDRAAFKIDLPAGGMAILA